MSESLLANFDVHQSANESQAMLEEFKASAVYKEFQASVHLGTYAMTFENILNLRSNNIYSVVVQKTNEYTPKQLLQSITDLQSLAESQGRTSVVEQIKLLQPLKLDNVRQKFNASPQVQKILRYQMHYLYLQKLMPLLTNAASMGVVLQAASLDSDQVTSEVLQGLEKSTGQLTDQVKQAAQKAAEKAKAAKAAGKTPEPAKPQVSTETTLQKTEALKSSPKHFVDNRTIMIMSVVMSTFLESITGSQEIRVLKSTNQTPETRRTAIQGSEIADRGIQALLTTDLDPKSPHKPDKVKRELDKIKPPRTFSFAGVSNDSPVQDFIPGQQVSGDRPTEMEKFTTRIASLPETTIVQVGPAPTPYRTIYLMLGSLQSSPKGKSHVKTVAAMFGVNPADPTLTEGITAVYGASTANAVISQLNSKQFKTQQQIFVRVSEVYADKLRQAEIKGKAGNLTKDPRKIAYMYMLFASGISALNAFLQTITALVESFETKKAGNLIGVLVNYWFFNKMFNISFQKLAGVAVHDNSSTFVERAIDNIFKVTLSQDMFEKDKATAKSTLSGFYQSYYHIKQGDKSLFEHPDFYPFISNVFVTSQNTIASPHDAHDPRLKPSHITSKAPDSIKSGVTQLVSQLQKDIKPPTLGMVPLLFFSLAIRATGVTSPQSLKDQIKQTRTAN